MAIRHIRLDPQNPEARFSAATMPRLEFRQALFFTKDTPFEWHRRLSRAALMVSTKAFDADGRQLVVDHQSQRFSLLYNHTWPDPVFKDIKRWNYAPVELRADAPVVGWLLEIRLRDLRLKEGEYVEVAFLG
jgi:hypothetical protein